MNETAPGNAPPSAPKQLQRVKAPIKIGVLGPLQGQDADFGLNQLRGVVSAAMHATVEYFGRPAEDWQKLFSIKPIDIELAFAGARRPEELAKVFRDAQAEKDAVFGPVTSQDAVDILVERKEPVKVPTIITVASTPKLSQHVQYGKLLLQLSPNINTYSFQYLRYVAEFMQPRPRHILLLARDDEYGRSSIFALTRDAARYQISVHPELFIPPDDQSLINSSYAASVLQKGGDSIDNIRKMPDDWLIMIADTGLVLSQLSLEIRSQIPNARIGTLSSPDFEQVSSGAFEGMYLIYSFAPVQFSLDTLAFYQYARAAQPYLDELLKASRKPGRWPRLDTVDAEVHDAAIFWIQHYAVNQLSDIKGNPLKNLYVTNFAIRGDGPSLSNEGALYLFRVQNKKIVPVEVNLD